MDYFCCFFSVPLASLGHWESKESFEKMWRERGRLLKWQKCLAFLGKNLKLWMGDRSRFWGLCGFIILNSKRWNDFVCWKKKKYIYIYIYWFKILRKRHEAVDHLMADDGDYYSKMITSLIISLHCTLYFWIK